jgi:iron complex outermembrane receptor protein
MKLQVFLKSFICCLMAALFTIQTTNAQTKTVIAGKVISATGTPVSYLTVSLLKDGDSTIAKGTLTDDNGVYAFSGITAGYYLVKVTGIGNKPAISAPFQVQSTETFNVPSLTIEAIANELAVVSIKASRPVIEHHSGKTIVNVENSVLAAGNTALDILARAPGVTLDKDDNISLQGKPGVTVMLDGRLTYLSGEQLSSLLRSTDGNNIKSIELLPSPPASYDAAGTSGIINIRLKKNTKSGTNISVTAGAAYGTHAGNTTAIAVNHSEGKLNVFANLSRGDFAQDRFVRIKRSLDSANTRTYFSQDGKVFDNRHNNSFRIGADYNLSSSNTVGVVLSGYTNPREKDNDSRTNVGVQPNNTDFFENTDSRSRFSAKNISGNLNDLIKLDTAGTEINVDLNYSKFHNGADAHYNTIYYTPTGSQLGIPQVLINQTPSVISIEALKADFIKPLTKQLKLEAGAKYSSVQADNDINAQKLSNGHFINDTTRSNQFLYKEKIAAGYITLNEHLKNTNITLGLRAEHTSSSGDLITSQSVVNKHYLNFFPNLLIEQALNAQNDLSFSYSRRINRPDYEDLNPFTYYVDQFTYIKGNAFLQPEYSHNFQLNYTYNKTWNAGFSYQQTDHVISGVFLTDTLKKSTVITKANLNRFQAYTLNVNFPLNLTAWWTASADLNGIYEQTQATGLTGYLNRGRATFQGKFTQQVRFAKVYTAEVMVNYSALEANGYDIIKPMFATDAGLSYSLLKKAVSIKLAVSNVFNGSVYHIISSAQGSNIDTRLNVIPRTAHLTFSYSIGNRKLSSHRRQSGSEEEERRVGSKS